jgi:hypothetical protein
MPFLEFIKIPSQRKKIEKIFGFGKFNEDSFEGCSNGKNNPLYIYLSVNDWFLNNCMLDSENFLLHNCMLDLGASANIMHLKVME